MSEPCLQALDAERIFAGTERHIDDVPLYDDLLALARSVDASAFPYAYELTGRWLSIHGWDEGAVLTIGDHPRTHAHRAYQPFVGSYEDRIDNGVIHDIRTIGGDRFVLSWSQIVWATRNGVLVSGFALMRREQDGAEDRLSGLIFKQVSNGSADDEKTLSRWRLKRLELT